MIHKSKITTLVFAGAFAASLLSGPAAAFSVKALDWPSGWDGKKPAKSGITRLDDTTRNLGIEKPAKKNTGKTVKRK